MFLFYFFIYFFIFFMDGGKTRLIAQFYKTLFGLWSYSDNKNFK